MSAWRSWGFATAIALTTVGSAQETIVTVLHTNDMHAHMEPSQLGNGMIGGYARQATLIKRFRARDPNPILLNAGDVFQGTLFFKSYHGLADLAYMNVVGYDAMCIGNHEFDEGPARLAEFVKLAKFPVLAANLDLSAEPALKDLVQPSTVLRVGNTRVGIVGAVTPDLPNISHLGPNARMLPLAASIQAGVDALTKAGVDKIFVLSHVGYEEEMKLATQLRDVDMIVGGHSHSPLGTPKLPGWPTPRGPYPTVATGVRGNKVYVVQAYEWGKVLGRIKVHFDAKGIVTRVSEAGPIVVDETVPEDPAVKSMIAAFATPFKDQAAKQVGVATREISKSGPNAMANLIADANFEAARAKGAAVAFVNLGGVRAGIDAGPITYGDVSAVLPFANTLQLMEVTGAELKAALEQGYPDGDKIGGRLFPSKGSSYRVDLRKPVGSRVSDIIVGGKPLDLQATVIIAINNFSAEGGDSLFALRDAKGKRSDTGLVDLNILLAYLQSHSPVDPPSDRRVVIVT
jgi:5'-nucleotidase